MKLTKANADCAAFTAKSALRPTLQKILVTKHATVATDSYVLMQVETLNSEWDTEEKPFLVEGAHLADVIKRTMGKDEDTFDLTAQATGGALAKTKNYVTGLDATDADAFPAFAQIMPKNPVVRLAVDARYLLAMAQFFKKHASDLSNRKVFIEIMNDTSPLKLSCVNEYGQKCTGIIMPLRLPEHERLQESERLREPVKEKPKPSAAAVKPICARGVNVADFPF